MTDPVETTDQEGIGRDDARASAASDGGEAAGPADGQSADGDLAAVADRLERARDRVASLAEDDGQYYVACRRTGLRPAPVSDARFADRATAERARVAGERYQRVLQRLDPRRRSYDLAVYEDDDDAGVSVTRVRETTGERRENGLPASRQSVLVAGPRSDEWLRMENGPVVHVTGDGSLLDDDVVSRQLEVKL